MNARIATTDVPSPSPVMALAQEVVPLATPLKSVGLTSATFDNEPIARKIKVLLVRPYQITPMVTETPPLGLLCLSASLKKAFADNVEVLMLDMKLYRQDPHKVISSLETFAPDIIGISAMNAEANAAKRIAALAKKNNPAIVTVLGGPYAHKRADEILRNSEFDWVVYGPGDRVFPQAIRRHINGHPPGTDMPGFCYKKADGSIHTTNDQDYIDDLDNLPLPDWEQVNFDLYSNRMNLITMQKGKRYGLLFTSRGCPYLCNYCHDIFGKRFKFQSAERVIAEIENLYENYGVTEFQVLDDIFNLHKPRVKQIMHEVHRRWPGKLHFTFPNGVRADIIDEDVLDDLRLGGTYAMCVAIETATPRLQNMVEKYLDLEKAKWVIEQANKRGIAVIGFFMLGFPTETEEELKATINFALTSKLSMAHFFTVIPQPGTPLYPLAESEGRETLIQSSKDDEAGKLTYRGDRGEASWYERTYKFPLSAFVHQATMDFYFTPSRIWRILRRIPPKSILRTGRGFLIMQWERLFKNVTFITRKETLNINPMDAQ